MKNKSEILNDSRILKVYKDVDNGLCSKLKLEVRSIKQSDKALVAFTCIDGWEHLSVSFKNKIPSWECMEEMKEMFFKDDEEAFQFHPKMDNYINNNPYTLHIWRKQDGTMEPPPHILVGFRKGHEKEDMQLAKELHERIGSPLTDEELQLFYMSSVGEKELKEQLDKMDKTDFLKLCAKIGVI